MFFRRKKHPVPAEQRALYRPLLSENHGLRVLLERPGAPFLEVSLRSLTFRGAGLEAPANYDIAIHQDDVFDVTLWKDDESWNVRTPAVVRRLDRTVEGKIGFGIEFINLGSLFGQMTDALGTYFNRRAFERVQPDAARPVTARLYSHGHRMPGAVHDLTPGGVALLVDHVLAVPLRTGADARVTLCLPTSKRELEGEAFIRQIRRLREQDFIGLEFDLEHPEGFRVHAELVRQYCAERERALHELDAAALAS